MCRVQSANVNVGAGRVRESVRVCVKCVYTVVYTHNIRACAHDATPKPEKNAADFIVYLIVDILSKELCNIHRRAIL